MAKTNNPLGGYGYNVYGPFLSLQEEERIDKAAHKHHMEFIHEDLKNDIKEAKELLHNEQTQTIEPMISNVKSTVLSAETEVQDSISKVAEKIVEVQKSITANTNSILSAIRSK